MLEDWSNSNYKISLPQKYTISWLKNKAMSEKLIEQKAPFLAAVIQSVDCSSKGPMIVLKDKNGMSFKKYIFFSLKIRLIIDEIQATLTEEIWDDYYEFLQSGSVIVLKQVAVLYTLKKYYLTITPINLITIYSGNNSETNEEAQTINLQKLTISDVIKTIEEVRKNAALKQAKRLKMQQSVVSINPYFKTYKNEQQFSKQNTNVDIAMQNKTLQLISNLRTANKNVCETNANINNLVASSSTPNKFKFKANSTELNKENHQQNSVITTESDTEILSQVLEGVDADSLFEDF